jgi:hypothetical protein
MAAMLDCSSAVQLVGFSNQGVCACIFGLIKGKWTTVAVGVPQGTCNTVKDVNSKLAPTVR